MTTATKKERKARLGAYGFCWVIAGWLDRL
jgi:hypothetical protein